MNARGYCVVIALTGVAGWVGDLMAADTPIQAVALKPVSAFSTISDERGRSVALFTEAARVIQSPRCMNCHPVKRQPTQGEDLHAHIPPMNAGPSDQGVAGMPCKSCHGTTNVTTAGSRIASIPGNPRWGLAPASMAWQGKTLGEICLQIKDERRNGERSLAEIHKHMATDPLVGWAWHPGEGRSPAPGTQPDFGALIQAWISSGAHCPES
jgi:hypothetical protein